MRRRSVVRERERPFYSDKARTNGWRGGHDLWRVRGKKREGERLFDTEDKLRVALSPGPRTKKLALKCFDATRPYPRCKFSFKGFQAKSFLCIEWEVSKIHHHIVGKVLAVLGKDISDYAIFF